MYNNYYEMAEGLEKFTQEVFDYLNGKVNKVIPVNKFIIHKEFYKKYWGELLCAGGTCYDATNEISVYLDGIILGGIKYYFKYFIEKDGIEQEEDNRAISLLYFREYIVYVVVHELCHAGQIPLRVVPGPCQYREVINEFYEIANELETNRYIKENIDVLVKEFNLNKDHLEEITHNNTHKNCMTNIEYIGYKDREHFVLDRIENMICYFNFGNVFVDALEKFNTVRLDFELKHSRRIFGVNLKWLDVKDGELQYKYLNITRFLEISEIVYDRDIERKYNAEMLFGNKACILHYTVNDVATDSKIGYILESLGIKSIPDVLLDID